MTETTQTKTNNRQRIATIISAAFTIFVGILTIYSLNVLPDATLANPTILIGVLIVLIAAGATWFSYKGQPQLSISVLSGAVMLCSLVYQFVQAQNGLLNSLLMFTIVTAMAVATLSDKWFRWVLRGAAVTAVLMILIDLFGPANRPIYSYSPLDYAMFTLFIGVLIFIINRQFSTFSLQGKMLVVFIGLMIMSIVTITLIISQRVESALTQRVGAGLQLQAESQADIVNIFFHEKVSQIQVLGLGDIIEETLEERNESYVGSSEQILAEIQALDEQWIAADDNDPLLLSVLSPDPEINEIAFQLSDVDRYLPDHVEVFVTDRYGATVASNNRLSDYYQADEAWWQAAWNDGQGAVYISDPEFDESANANALLIAVPIYADDSREVLGIMRSTLTVDSLFALIDELKFGETGHTVVFNSMGDIIHDPQSEDDGGSAALPPELLQELVSGGEDFLIAADERGDESVFGHTLLHVEAEVDRNDTSLSGQIATAVLNLGWVVVARQEATEALADVNVISRTIQLIGLVIVALASGAAVYLARTMTRPLQALNEATAAIGAGQLDTPLPATGDDEVGQLAGTFRQMVDYLQKTLGDLQATGRDLALTVEVGREVTQVQELETMLQNAVNIIRDRFNLYYAQIYLADPTESSLILRAGTGEAGQKLVQRGHRLPIGPGSLNGLVAASQQVEVVTDTAASVGHRPNPLLPDTRSEMVVPLLANNRLVGVLDLQSNRVNGLTEENIPGFMSLAAQLAVAIQNATLFSETQQARAEVEASNLRLAQQGWQGFLNGIDRSQYLASAYDLTHETALTQLPDLAEDEHELAVPITVTGAEVGAIRLADYAGRDWTKAETEILTAVADKAARHIENLRLLTEAEKYRTEAEAVARRLTREGWQEYQASNRQSASGFVYNQQSVLPIAEDLDGATIHQPLLVRGETIGKLTISGISRLDTASQKILQSLTDKVEERMETLRLSHQIEQSLAQTEEQARRLAVLNQMSQEIGSVTEVEAIYQTIIRHLGQIIQYDRASLALAEEENDFVQIYALDGEQGVIPTGTRLPMNGTAIGTAIQRNHLLALPKEGEMASYPDSAKMAEAGLQTTLLIPLVASGRIIGTLNVGHKTATAYSDLDEYIGSQVGTLLATAIEARRLDERARLLASIVENHPDFIGVGSLEGKALYVNPAGLRMMNLPADYDVSQMGAANFYPPEDAQTFMEEGFPIFMETGSWTREANLRSSDGFLIPVEETVGLNYDANDKPISFSITIRDITERKRSEEELATSFSLLETTLESTADGILVVDGKGGIVRFNQKFSEMWQMPEDILASRDDNQAIGHVLSQLVDPDAFVSKVQALYGDEESDSFDILHFKDGRIFERYSQPQRLENRVIGRVWSFRDVTERELNQAALAEQANRLALLNEIGKELSEVATAEEAFKVVAGQMAGILGSARASVALLQADKNTFEVFALDGIKGVLPTGTHLPVANTLLGVAATEQRIVRTVDTETSPYLDAKALSQKGVQSIMNAPLIVAGEVLGTLNVASLKPDAFGSREENLLVQVASLLAATLENRRLFAEAQALAEQEQLINNITQKIQQTRTMKGALQVAVQELGQAFQAQRTAVQLSPADRKIKETNGR